MVARFIAYAASIFTLCAVASFAGTKSTPATLQKALSGNWALTELKCNGAVQPLEKMDYSLSFSGTSGAYVSKNATCKQIEPELYKYTSGTTVTIKQGIRTCNPSPCAADLEAGQCGKETNAQTPEFNVTFKDQGRTMILTTSDPKSIDCVGAGQSKPAVFTFAKK